MSNRRFWCSIVLSMVAVSSSGAETTTFGSYRNPFGADAPWNSRPVQPVLGSDAIPKAKYEATVSEGPWSTGVFLAKDADPPMTIKGAPGTQGVWDPDTEQMREVTLPHWPADISPAPEADGHAEIVDPSLGVVHSFWQLKKINGQWTAALYGWSRLGGRGFGDPAHYYQGARAAGVPTAGGLIRKHEIDDGDTMYRHALAASLDFSGLAADPAYVFPATSADAGADKNSGRIPEGALLMLPRDFDVQKLTTPEVRKVAETLKTYGAYVVDRNVGVPFVIYAELGSGYNLHKGGWNGGAMADLDAIRQALRPVVSATEWIAGDGRRYVPTRNFNLLSMRGPWTPERGKPAGVYDTWKQAVVFPPAGVPMRQTNATGHGLHAVDWALPKPGQRYRVKAVTTGGAMLRVFFRNALGVATVDSGDLADGATKTFTWPAGQTMIVEAVSGTGPGVVTTVAGELVKMDP